MNNQPTPNLTPSELEEVVSVSIDGDLVEIRCYASRDGGWTRLTGRDHARNAGYLENLRDRELPIRRPAPGVFEFGKPKFAEAFEAVEDFLNGLKPTFEWRGFVYVWFPTARGWEGINRNRQSRRAA